MRYFLSISTILFTMFTSDIYAGGWNGPALVDTINVNGNGWYVTAISLVGITFNEPGCTKTAAMISYDHPGHNAFLSTLLSAKMSSKEVSVITEACNQYGYPIVKEVSLR